MKVFQSRFTNIGYLFYRLIKPVVDPIRLFQGLWGYFWFLSDILRYKAKGGRGNIIGMSLYPILEDKTSFTPFDAHYFFQDTWAFENILARKPGKHVDVGSRYEMSGYLSKVVKTVFVDLRPIDTRSKNLEIKKGDILHLPFPDNSVESLSSLSVAEHIGLGRYGDEINPEGTRMACAELARVLARGGHLYFSLPIGKERLCFNAHRIHLPRTILDYFRGLTLVQFSVVDDNGSFFENVRPEDYEKINFGCGLFLFTKVNDK